MIKKYALLLFIFLSFQTLFSQSVKLSVYSQISVVTVGPGEKLYERFGHSAIRVKDPVLNLDLIYNYGIFDTSGPNFYVNFTKGRMIYKLAGYPFHYFVKSYNEDKRWIKEQVLNLTQEQRQQCFMFLHNNAQPQNASYEYDPFFENCATKMPDVVKKILGDKVSFSEEFVTEDLSFRQLMNRKIYWNTWGSLGINVALGSKLDKIATAKQYMYLPDYVYEAFKNGTVYIKNQPEKLVKKENEILKFKEIPSKSDFISPLLVFGILLLIGLYITYKDYKTKNRTKWFDFLLFFTTGIVGLLIVFLWFFTNHSTTPNNFNFLWAFAPNLVVSFFLLKKNLPKWIRLYVVFLLILLIIIPIVWLSKIQLFAWSLLPVFILLFLRYLFLQNQLLTFHKNYCRYSFYNNFKV